MTPQTIRVACSNCNLRELCMPMGLSESDIGRLDDLVATRRLGTCEVVSITSAHSLTVRALDNHTHYRISGIDFGTGARLREP